MTGSPGGARRGRRRDPARRRPELPVEALQRRVDAGERPAGDDRRRHPRRRAARRPPPRDGPCPPVVVARTTERVGDAIATLQEYGISQMPVSEDARRRRGRRASSARSTRRACSIAAFRDPSVVERTVGEVMDPPLPLDRRVGDRSTRRSRCCQAARPPSSPIRGERPAGVVTKLDLLEYLDPPRRAARLAEARARRRVSEGSLSDRVRNNVHPLSNPAQLVG